MAQPRLMSTQSLSSTLRGSSISSGSRTASPLPPQWETPTLTPRRSKVTCPSILVACYIVQMCAALLADTNWQNSKGVQHRCRRECLHLRAKHSTKSDICFCLHTELRTPIRSSGEEENEDTAQLQKDIQKVREAMQSEGEATSKRRLSTDVTDSPPSSPAHPGNTPLACIISYFRWGESCHAIKEKHDVVRQHLDWKLAESATKHESHSLCCEN